MDHAQYVLSGILPSHGENLVYATTHLTPEHFTAATQRVIFAALDKYYEQTGGVMPKAPFLDFLTRKDTDLAKILFFEEVFDDAVNTAVSDHEFRYAVQALKDMLEDRKTGEAITSAYAVLGSGIEVDGKKLQGPKDARTLILDKVGEIERLAVGATYAPEGNISDETDDLLAAYIDAKTGKKATGVMLGLPTIDRAIGGISPGDLALLTAFTSQGKTQHCAQLAWTAAVEQGKNVFFATTETVRGEVIARIIARHSLHPKFEFPAGIDFAQIERGTLSVPEEKILVAVLEDLKTGPYGKLHIAQVTRGATLSYVESRMRKFAQNWEAGLAVIDSLNLLKPGARRGSEREEFNDMLRDAKALAVTFNDGKGVPIVSPWQMSRDAYSKALQVGFYELGSLSDTSEAEKTPDLVFSHLRFNDSPKKLKFQALKVRGSAIPPMLDLDVDFRCAYLAEASGGGYASMEGLAF